MAQVTFKLVKVTQQIKGISFKNNKKGEHIFFKTYFAICAFLCNFEQSDEKKFLTNTVQTRIIAYTRLVA